MGTAKKQVKLDDTRDRIKDVLDTHGLRCGSISTHQSNLSLVNKIKKAPAVIDKIHTVVRENELDCCHRKAGKILCNSWPWTIAYRAPASR